MTTRIQPTTTPEPKSEELLAGVKKMLGATPNIFTTMAHSPAALGFYVNSIGTLGTAKLSRPLHEKLALTIAGLNGCDYCASAHTKFGGMQKIAADELASNLNGESNDAKTQAALTFARQIVEGRGHVSDADVETVRAAGYSDAEIIEIVALVGINTFTNYFNNIVGTVVDFPLVSTSDVAHAA